MVLNYEHVTEINYLKGIACNFYVYRYELRDNISGDILYIGWTSRERK
jgi:hypothetical protein